MAPQRARRGAVQIWRLIPAARVRLGAGCKNAFDQFLFPRVPLRYALPGRSWRPVTGGRMWASAPTKYRCPSEPRRGRCLHRPVAGTLINYRPAAAKRETTQCDDHPDEAGTIRHGTAVGGTAEESSVPEGQAKSAQAPIRRPPSARRATAPERAKRRSFLLDRARPVSLFGQDQ